MNERTIEDMMDGVRIGCVSTVPWLLASQLKPQIEYLNKIGADVVLISSKGWGISSYTQNSSLFHVPVHMERSISLKRDLVAVFKLYRTFRKYKFDIVHSTTPKAGFLTAIAAYLARIPVRLHTFTGQPWVTLQGMSGRCAKVADKVVAKLNTKCFADSKSQREFLVDMKIVDDNRISVLGSGSLAGIDIKRFNPGRFTLFERDKLKRKLKIPKSSKIIIHLGRIAHDKGITELVSAFRGLLDLKYNVKLLLVGPMDVRDAISLECAKVIERNPHICRLDSTDTPERYLAIADIMCLPSYREGFGTAVVEAAAMGIPSVGTRINGLVDAIVDGETGFLVPVKDVPSLQTTLSRFLDSPELIRMMGISARKRAIENYDSDLMNFNVVGEYARLLKCH